MLLLLTTRERVAWVEVGAHVGHVCLDRLRAEEAGALLADLWPRDKAGRIPPAAVSLSYQRTNGVPLFFEEICHWLAGALTAGQTEWMELLSNARISSFENLLSARLGELGPAKNVDQAASVIGREFDTELLHAIVPENSGQSPFGGIRPTAQGEYSGPQEAWLTARLCIPPFSDPGDIVRRAAAQIARCAAPTDLCCRHHPPS